MNSLAPCFVHSSSSGKTDRHSCPAADGRALSLGRGSAERALWSLTVSESLAQSCSGRGPIAFPPLHRCKSRMQPSAHWPLQLHIPYRFFCRHGP